MFFVVVVAYKSRGRRSRLETGRRPRGQHTHSLTHTCTMRRNVEIRSSRTKFHREGEREGEKEQERRETCGCNYKWMMSWHGMSANQPLGRAGRRHQETPHFPHHMLSATASGWKPAQGSSAPSIHICFGGIFIAVNQYGDVVVEVAAGANSKQVTHQTEQAFHDAFFLHKPLGEEGGEVGGGGGGGCIEEKEQEQEEVEDWNYVRIKSFQNRNKFQYFSGLTSYRNVPAIFISEPL